MESGEGENFEKCSMCLGTLAKAAFFIINLTNFIIAVERLRLKLTEPARPLIAGSSSHGRGASYSQ